MEDIVNFYYESPVKAIILGILLLAFAVYILSLIFTWLYCVITGKEFLNTSIARFANRLEHGMDSAENKLVEPVANIIGKVILIAIIATIIIGVIVVIFFIL